MISIIVLLRRPACPLPGSGWPSQGAPAMMRLSSSETGRPIALHGSARFRGRPLAPLVLSFNLARGPVAAIADNIKFVAV